MIVNGVNVNFICFLNILRRHFRSHIDRPFSYFYDPFCAANYWETIHKKCKMFNTNWWNIAAEQDYSQYIQYIFIRISLWKMLRQQHFWIGIQKCCQKAFQKWSWQMYSKIPLRHPPASCSMVIVLDFTSNRAC